MERHVMLAQHANAGECPLEGTAARTGDPLGVMHPLGAVDADANVDIACFEEFAPRRSDEHSIGLNGMLQLQVAGPKSFDGRESGLVKRDWQNERLASVPNDGETLPYPTRREYLVKQRGDGVLRHLALVIAIR